MVCTGSEANDIALRMAQAVTGKTGIIATDNTYHGNTCGDLAAVHAPPADRRVSRGNVRLVPAPDSLRARGRDRSRGRREAFAGDVARAIRDLEASGSGFSGLMLCPVFANEGFPTVPPGFLDPTVAVVRRAGGLILCDEVQPGFGRMGSHFWGHDALGFAPDVVTLGKPMANGHPVAAVVARPDVMAAFREAFGYFNTFGGNPVSAAAATAVLDVIAEEELMPRAAKTAARTMKLLRGLKHPAIREVRGAGLFFGLVLEEDGQARDGARRAGGRGDEGPRRPDRADRAAHEHPEAPPAHALRRGRGGACRRHARRRASRLRMIAEEARPALGRSGRAAAHQGPRERGLRDRPAGRRTARRCGFTGPATRAQAAIRSELWWMARLAEAGVPVPQPRADAGRGAWWRRSLGARRRS